MVGGRFIDAACVFSGMVFFMVANSYFEGFK